MSRDLGAGNSSLRGVSALNPSAISWASLLCPIVAAVVCTVQDLCKTGPQHPAVGCRRISKDFFWQLMVAGRDIFLSSPASDRFPVLL